MVRIHPDPPHRVIDAGPTGRQHGAVAQLGEHLLCKQGVVGSIPISSTTYRLRRGPRLSTAFCVGGKVQR